MIKLWEIVEKEKIKVKYRDLSEAAERPYGLYIHCAKTGPLIFLDPLLKHSRRMHRCVLAEEIGHFYTTPRTNPLKSYTSANLKIMNSQDERKAMQWAADFLMPDLEVTKAFEVGCRGCFELAEYFDVTEWFVQRKLGFWKMRFRRTGLKVRGKGFV